MNPALKIAYQPYKWIIVIPFILVATVLIGLICIIGGFAFNQDAINIFAVTWAKLCCRIVPLTISITGLENYDRNKSYVVIANHQSMVDIPAIHGYLGLKIKWVMKKKLGNIPIFGSACHGLGCIFVDRKNHKAAIQSIEQAKKRLSKQASVFFFPEGTRSRDGKVLPFKKGAFKFAQETGLPLLPITIKNSGNILPTDTLNLIPGTIELIVHPPVERIDSNSGAIEKTMNQTQKLIENSL